MVTRMRATIQDLANVPEKGKAEIINGELVRILPAGGMPGRAAAKIVLSLLNHEAEHGGGYALGGNVAFIVELPNRDSFSPDSAWYTGKIDGMKFLQGAPALAVEVRNEGDYGEKIETQIAEKRRDYFSAGTLVVWDVNLLADNVIKCYRYTDPETPILYQRGDVAEAETAVPGWTMLVDELFE